MKKRAIKFTKAVTPYKEGEVATFEEKDAERHIKAGYAEHHSWVGEEAKSESKKSEEKKEGDK